MNFYKRICFVVLSWSVNLYRKNTNRISIEHCQFILNNFHSGWRKKAKEFTGTTKKATKNQFNQRNRNIFRFVNINLNLNMIMHHHHIETGTMAQYPLHFETKCKRKPSIELSMRSNITSTKLIWYLLPICCGLLR